MRNTILVSEIFGTTIQGEGPLAGMPTVFIRTGGCDFHCSWCDSLHAVEIKNRAEWEEMSPDDIWDKVLTISRGFPLLISLSGGNPALQPLEKLLDLGHADDYTFALETQGTIAKSWFSKLDYLILSPKPPSSGMTFNRFKLDNCLHLAGDRPQLALKVVVFDEKDYEFARDVAAQFPALPCYLQAGTPQVTEQIFADDASRYRYLVAKIVERTRWLIEQVKADHWYSVRVSFQQHVILWGDQRGV
jgi:7-carboxy-7-deazaguanine synthase